MHRYAQIDSNGNIISDSYLSSPVTDNYMIPIDENFDLNDKKYIEGQWVIEKDNKIKNDISFLKKLFR